MVGKIRLDFGGRNAPRRMRAALRRDRGPDKSKPSDTCPLRQPQPAQQSRFALAPLTVLYRGRSQAARMSGKNGESALALRTLHYRKLAARVLPNPVRQLPRAAAVRPDGTGEIPPELGNLANLEFPRLSGNRLTSCVPDRLRYVTRNDLADLELQFCAP